jgi:ABC-type sugar transport system permease subunit
MAIAATALAVIFLFVYAPDPDIGLLNAVLGVANAGPVCRGWARSPPSTTP